MGMRWGLLWSRWMDGNAEEGREEGKEERGPFGGCLAWHAHAKVVPDSQPIRGLRETCRSWGNLSSGRYYITACSCLAVWTSATSSTPSSSFLGVFVVVWVGDPTRSISGIFLVCLRLSLVSLDLGLETSSPPRRPTPPPPDPGRCSCCFSCEPNTRSDLTAPGPRR